MLDLFLPLNFRFLISFLLILDLLLFSLFTCFDYFSFFNIFHTAHVCYINESQDEEYPNHSNHHHCQWWFWTRDNFGLHWAQFKSLTCIFHFSLLHLNFYVVDVMDCLKRRIKLRIFCIHPCLLSKYSIISSWFIALLFIMCKLIGICSDWIWLNNINKVLRLH